VNRALGICLATSLLLSVPACDPKPREVDVAAEIARNLKEGDSNLRNNLIGEAEASYKQVLAREPDNAAALTGLGRVALERKDPAGAIEPLTKAVAAGAGDALAHASLGRAYAGVEDWPNAAEQLGKAWELAEETEQYGLEYGVALREAKQLDKAVEVLTEIAELNPRIKYVYRELAKVHLAADDLDKALRSFMKAQSTWAGDQDSYAGAALVYEAQGNTSKAIDQWSQYIQQDCCSTYSKDLAQPKLAELKAKENAEGNAPAPAPDADEG
jgi:tetratricopeptide (TPR) repeat protein